MSSFNQRFLYGGAAGVMALVINACGNMQPVQPFNVTASLTPGMQTVVVDDSVLFQIRIESDGPAAARPQLVSCRIADTTIAVIRIAGAECVARGRQAGQTAVTGVISTGATVQANLIVVARGGA